MNQISFITANFVARELNYHMTEGWMQGDTATQAYFRPLETFEARFDRMLREIVVMGFDTIDLWGAHLHPDWASDTHLQLARERLKHHGLRVSALAAWCGSLESIKGFCRVAVGVGAPVIGGGAPSLSSHRNEAVAILKEHNVKLALENHPEKTPQDVLEQIGDGAGGFIGHASDTGWWATQGFDAAVAIRELKDHLLAVHLKDIKAVGAHDTCRYGSGIVNIAACTQTLREIGYHGPIGVEHEPEHHNPTQDVIAGLGLLKGWLGIQA